MNARRSQDPESIVRDIRRNTRRKYSTEEKIRIVLEGLKGEVSIVELLGHAYPPLIQYTSWPLTQKYLHALRPHGWATGSLYLPQQSWSISPAHRTGIWQVVSRSGPPVLPESESRTRVHAPRSRLPSARPIHGVRPALDWLCRMLITLRTANAPCLQQGDLTASQSRLGETVSKRSLRH